MAPLTGAITEAKKGTGDDATVELQHGTFTKWFVVIEKPNGSVVKTSILRKPDSPDPTGLPAMSENGERWKVAPKQGGGGGGGGGKSYEADPRGLRSRNASTALSYAKDLVIADKIKLDQLSLYAGKCYEFIESHGKVGE